jgi:glycosyltransferase involved in cell wall biosynthesis
MKILHIIPGLQIGGAEVFLENLINAWPRNNDVHTIVCFHGGVIAERLRSKGVEIIELSSSKTSNPITFIRNFFRLSKAIDAVCPDVVFSSLWSANIFARFLCWIKRIPLISVWHNNAQFLGCFRRYLDGFTAIVFPGKVIAVAHSVLDSYIQLPFLGKRLKNKVVVVENGVNVSALLDGKLRHDLRHKFKLSAGRFVFGAVGRLIPVKAFANLIEAFNVFLQTQFSLNDVQVGDLPMLCIVGDGPEAESLKALVERLKLSAHVVLCGQQDDVAPLYHGFSAYVSSSITEGLSVALLEALAVGLPFVITRAGDPNGLFSPDVDGIVVDSHEVVDLAFGLIKMYSEYDKYARNAESRTVLVRKFYSIARTAEQYATLVDKVV